MPEIEYAVALFRHSGDNKPQQEFWSWEELAVRFTSHTRRPDKEGPLWSPTLYRPGSTRGKANVLTLSCLVLDFDRGDELSAVAETGGWHALAYLAHSTHSHTPARPKWRAVFPLSRPLTAEEWETFFPRAAFALAGNLCDRVCRDSSRIYYLPSCPWDAEPFVHLNSGAALHVDSLLSLDLPQPEPPPVNQGPRPAAGSTFRGQGDYRTLDVVAWFTAHGAYGRPLGGDKHAVLCPWVNEHTEQRRAEHSDTAVWEAREPFFPAFHCQHAHCDGRRIHDVMALWGDADQFCREAYRPETPPPPEEPPPSEEWTGEEETVPPSFAGPEEPPAEGSAAAILAALPTITAAELKHKKVPDAVFVVPDLIPEGATLLVAHSKAGKTFLEVDISGGVSLGGKVLSKIDVTQGKVCCIAMEDGERRMKSRLTDLFEGEAEWPEAFRFYWDWPTMNRFGCEVLEHWIQSNLPVRLIVIDTWNAVRPAYSKNGDLVKEDYENIRRINKIGLKYHCGIVIVHHMAKSAVTDFVNQGSGTHALPAAAEAILAFQRTRGEHQGTLSVTGKDLREEEWRMLRNERTGFWALIETEDQAQHSELRTEVLVLIEQRGPSTCRQIAGILDRDEGGLWKGLKRMTDAGLLICEDKRYRLPSATETLFQSQNTKSREDGRTFL